MYYASGLTAQSIPISPEPNDPAPLPDPRPRPQPSPIRRLTKSRLNCRIRRGDLRDTRLQIVCLLIREYIVTAFSTLTVLPAAQLANLNELGYLSMTPVQAAALPAILAGKDVRVQAKPAAEKRPHLGWVCCSISIRRASRPSRWCYARPASWPIRSPASCAAARCLPNIKILMLCGGQPFGASEIPCSMPRILSSPPRAVCSIICRRERSPLTRCRPR